MLSKLNRKASLKNTEQTVKFTLHLSELKASEPREFVSFHAPTSRTRRRRSSKKCLKTRRGKRCLTRTTLCLVERVIPPSADPGRNSSLRDVRTFGGVRRSNAACTFSYINVSSFVSPFCGQPHIRIVRMSILRSCRRDVLCHDANVAMRRIRLINARARNITRGSRDYALYAF